MMNKRELRLNTRDVVGEVGDDVNFEVIDKSSDTIVLRQIFPSTNFSNEFIKQKNITGVKKLFDQSKFTKDNKNIMSEISEINKEIVEEKQALSRIRRNLMYVKNSSNRNIVNELLASGLSLEKIDLKMLRAVIKESKTIKPVNDRPIDLDQNLKINSTKQDFRDYSKLLDNRGINSNERNIDSIKSVFNKLDEIMDIDEKTIFKLLRDEKSLTIENIYISKYSSKDSSINISEEDLKNLKEQISEVLSSQNTEVNEKNIDISKKFISNNIPITQNNIQMYKFLSLLKESIDKENVLNKSIDNIKNEKSVSDIDLYELNNSKKLFNKYEKIIDSLKNIDPQRVDFLAEEGKEITLDNLINYKEESKGVSITSNITAKRQLAEISLKLTYEAAQRLSDKNIEIDTIPLENALKELKKLENESYAKNLNIMDVPVTEENINTISSLYEKINTFSAIDYLTYREIYEKEIPFTVMGVSSSVLRNYEANVTEILGKFGDTYKKVQLDIPRFLEDMGLHATKTY